MQNRHGIGQCHLEERAGSEYQNQEQKAEDEHRDGQLKLLVRQDRLGEAAHT